MFGLKYLVCFVSVLCGLHLTAMAAEEERSVSDYLLPVVELLSRGDPALMPAGGNKVEVITDGRMLWERMLQDIRNARRSIRIEYYRWAPDEAGDQIREAVLEKLAEGVQVQILIENLCSPFLPKSFYQKMEKAGARLLFFTDTDGSPSRFFRGIRYRDHRKILVIDEETGYTGGTNIAKKYRDEWRDTNIRIKGPAAALLGRFFDEMWERRGGAPLEASLAEPQPVEGGVTVQLCTFGAGDTIMVAAICKMLELARERVYIQTPYFCPTESILRAMREAAERGVDVRILLPKEVDEPFMKLANESFYEECLEKPVKIYEYTPRFDHTKMVLCDRNLSLLGSTNMDYLSLLINYEIAALVCDAALTEKLSSDFLRLLDDAEEITLEGARAAFRKDKHDRSFWHLLRKRL